MKARSRVLRTAALFAAVAGVGLVTLQGCDGAGDGQYMSIGTGNTGGVYYPFGGALASRLSALDPDRQYTAEVTAASVENVRRLVRDQIDFGFSITTTVVTAYEGGDIQFPEPVEDLRIVAPLWPNPITIMVPANQGIQGVADVRGQRVSVGSAGSGTEQFSRMLLEAYGMSFDDINERFLSFTESSSAIRDGSISMAIMPVAYPAAAVMEATTTGGAQLLPLRGPEIDAMMEEYPYFFYTHIPGGVYRGVDEDLPTIAELNWILARESLDPQIVRNILDVLYHERDRLIQVNEIARQIDFENFQHALIPLHPATIEWLEENMGPEAMAGLRQPEVAP